MTCPTMPLLACMAGVDGSMNGRFSHVFNRAWGRALRPRACWPIYHIWASLFPTGEDKTGLAFHVSPTSRMAASAF